MRMKRENGVTSQGDCQVQGSEGDTALMPCAAMVVSDVPPGLKSPGKKFQVLIAQGEKLISS